MVKIVLAWELGGGFGHARRLAAIGQDLQQRGHRLAVAAVVPARVVAAGLQDAEVMAVPQWPRVASATDKTFAAATFGDLLGELLFANTPEIEQRLAIWDEVLRSSQADLLIADYAPGAVLAARGRIPIVNMGDSYYLPPPEMPKFPKLFKAEAKLEEAQVVALINSVLKPRSVPPLVSFPDVGRADATVVTNFPALDIYAKWRKQEIAIGPLAPMPAMAEGRASDLFGYLSPGTEFNPRIIAGLQASGLVGRVVIPNMQPIPGLDPFRSALRFTGQMADLVIALPSAGVLVTHGGAQTVAAGLAAGVPQIVITGDDEKRLIGRRIDELSVGKSLRGENLQSAELAAAIREVAQSSKYRRAARQVPSACQGIVKQNPRQKFLSRVEEILEKFGS